MRVVSVNISEKKGTRKVSRPEAVLKTNWGIEGDSHADGSHRQLSLLGIEDIDYMRSMGADVKPGDFAENITTEGVELSTYPIGTHFRIGEDILLELTQIGKECHSGCEIRRLVGTCIMPKKGVFCRILKGGTVKPGDPFFVVNEKAGQQSVSLFCAVAEGVSPDGKTPSVFLFYSGLLEHNTGNLGSDCESVRGLYVHDC